MIITRFADDFVAGFDNKVDAQRFLADLRERFAKSGLELLPDKTRLIEFGRFAAERRAPRGLGKPETFDFLASRTFAGRRGAGVSGSSASPSRSGCGAKLAEVKDQLRRRQHQPIPEQGKWLASVVRGHLAY